ncbi:hypothetical protein DFO53_1361 [Enterobacter sp. AG5470]|nr:hypothetical protein DFO53_1361 [Enterobacter sp. AG5470]
MNTFLTDLVTLNRVILANAAQQFPGVAKPQLRALRALPTDLTAAVSTEIVSGEIRYQITTAKKETGWIMTLDFDLNQAVSTLPDVVLSFSTFGDETEMRFQQVETKPSGGNRYQARLLLSLPSERDALLRALDSYDSQTTLVVALKTHEGLLNTVTVPTVFYFSQTYYPYIYQGLLPPPPVRQLTLLNIPFNTHNDHYFQDYVHPEYLFYLPDRFALATDAENDNKPMLSISFSAPEHATSLDQINVTFDYFILPQVDQARIANAQTVFHDHYAQPQGQLFPLANAHALTLRLSLPAGMTEEKNALIDLQSGIVDAFTLPSSQFGQIWDALFDTAQQSLLLKGFLKVELVGFDPENTPVQLALDAKYKNTPRTFIKQSAPVDITKTLEFKSDKDAFDPYGPKPISRILISVGGQTIELDKDHTSQKVDVKVSVLEQILNPSSKLVYHYDMQIYYVSGGRKDLPDQQTTFEVIYVP